ncbi:hypothetical protein BDF14DRAFT_1855580 [Spinellus fusiger]|nr:hypothetical protein BDF14DRAFT_1855580 [Spinellus fusiger]
MALSIELHSTCVILSRKAKVSGLIKLQAHTSHLPDTAKLRFYGNEHVQNDYREIYACEIDLKCHNQWVLTCKETEEYSLAFSIDIPSHLPCSFQAIAYDGELEYNLMASVSSEMGVLYSLQQIIVTQATVMQPPKLCWGTSPLPMRRWRYEIEVPQTISLNTIPIIKVRLQSAIFESTKTNKDTLETCLIGVQLYESSQIGKQSVAYVDPLITQTHLLVAPSLSWKSPCEIALGYRSDRLPAIDLSTPLQRIRHTVRITLAFCNVHSDNDHFSIELPITVVSSPPTSFVPHPTKPGCSVESDGKSLDSAIGSLTPSCSSSSVCLL